MKEFLLELAALMEKHDVQIVDLAEHTYFKNNKNQTFDIHCNDKILEFVIIPKTLKQLAEEME